MSLRGSVVAGAACVAVSAFVWVSGWSGYSTAGGGKDGVAGAAKTNPAFERMRQLAGDWEGTAGMSDDKHPAQLSVRSTAGGSALVETEFCGSDHEMMTIMYLDQGELVLTHYCHLANQPHMKGRMINDKEIVFEFAGGTNIDPKIDMHMHEARYHFIDDDHFTSTWTLYDGGKEKMKATMEMARKKPADHAPPKQAPAKAALPPLELQFETDERLYVVIAWLHWVGDRDSTESAALQFPEEKLLKEHLNAQNLPDDLRKRHRLAYDAYLPDHDLYIKNGLLLRDSMAYGQPPAFGAKPFVDLEPAERKRSVLMPGNFPAATLIAEFYEKAKLQELWVRHMKQAHSQAMEHYRERAARILEETYAQLKVPIDVPVSLRFNLVGQYGILGQTVYSPWEKRYLIKLHFSPIARDSDETAVEYWETENLRVIRHEFSHVLLNDAVMEHAQLLSPLLTSLREELKFDWLENLHVQSMAPEWIADCMGYLDLETNLHENVAYYNHNPLYMHFIERLPDFRASGKSFADFIPDLFKSFDPDKEIARWKSLIAKKKQSG